jgi:hypothetical protein
MCLLHVSRVYARAVGLWLVASLALASTLLLILPLSAVPASRLAYSALGGGASVFVMGLPFCSLIVTLRLARRGGRSDYIALAGVALSLLSCVVVAGLTGNEIRQALAVLVEGQPLAARQSLRFGSSASLCLLPFLLTVLGLLMARSPVVGHMIPRAAQNVTAALVAVAILGAIGTQNLLFTRMPPALLGWAPSLIAMAAVLVLASLRLLGRSGDDVAGPSSIGIV